MTLSGIFAAILQKALRTAALFLSRPPLTNCCVASVNREFCATMARRLNQSRVSAVLWSNLIGIKFGTVEARRLNWVLIYLSVL